MVGEIPFFGLCHFCSMFYIRFHSASRFTPFFSSLISNYQFKYIVLAWTVRKAITNRISLAVVLFFVSSMVNIKNTRSHIARPLIVSVWHQADDRNQPRVKNVYVLNDDVAFEYADPLFRCELSIHGKRQKKQMIFSLFSGCVFFHSLSSEKRKSSNFSLASFVPVF